MSKIRAECRANRRLCLCLEGVRIKSSVNFMVKAVFGR